MNIGGDFERIEIELGLLHKSYKYEMSLEKSSV